jgi:hypothetical protein
MNMTAIEAAILLENKAKAAEGIAQGIFGMLPDDIEKDHIAMRMGAAALRDSIPRGHAKKELTEEQTGEKPKPVKQDRSYWNAPGCGPLIP